MKAFDELVDAKYGVVSDTDIISVLSEEQGVIWGDMLSAVPGTIDDEAVREVCMSIANSFLVDWGAAHRVCGIELYESLDPTFSEDEHTNDDYVWFFEPVDLA
jgi:hypothetical protein